MESVSRGDAWTDERLDDLNGRVDDLGRRMDAGFARVDERFAQVDLRFAQVEARMDAGFARTDERMDAGFARVDGDIRALRSEIGALNRTMLRIGSGVIVTLAVGFVSVAAAA